jgi:Ca-activated chloride channel family protein
MTLLWPAGLAALALVPAVLALYLLALRRRRRSAVTVSSLSLLRQAVPPGSRWRRHLPLAALLGALVLLGLATARPEVTTTARVGEATVILALDESGSMCSTDVSPNRIGAAQQAARYFVSTQPSGTAVGLVEFNGFAELAVAPTHDRAPLVQAIDNLATGPGTAIGAAILQSIDAIAQVDSQVRPVGLAADSPIGLAEGYNGGGPSGASGATTGPPTKPGKHGYVPDVIVLLTDGSNNRGISPIAAAGYAAARGVRVYTIGFGTTHPKPLLCTPQQMGGESYVGLGQGYGGYGGGGAYGAPPGYGSYGGFHSPLVADLPALRRVSQLTGASSYAARNVSELERVFADLPKDVTLQREHHELSVLFAALGALLTLAAAAASMRWGAYP